MDNMTVKYLEKAAAAMEEYAETTEDPEVAKVALDMALRMDMMSDHLEGKPIGFDPALIGVEKSGPLEMDSDDSAISGHFIQNNREVQKAKSRNQWAVEDSAVAPNPGVQVFLKQAKKAARIAGNDRLYKALVLASKIAAEEDSEEESKEVLLKRASVCHQAADEVEAEEGDEGAERVANLRRAAVAAERKARSLED